MARGGGDSEKEWLGMLRWGGGCFVRGLLWVIRFGGRLFYSGPYSLSLPLVCVLGCDGV